jgi:hypothetical protein
VEEKFRITPDRFASMDWFRTSRVQSIAAVTSMAIAEQLPPAATVVEQPVGPAPDPPGIGGGAVRHDQPPDGRFVLETAYAPGQFFRCLIGQGQL